LNSTFNSKPIIRRQKFCILNRHHHLTHQRTLEKHTPLISTRTSLSPSHTHLHAHTHIHENTHKHTYTRTFAHSTKFSADVTSEVATLSHIRIEAEQQQQQQQQLQQQQHLLKRKIKRRTDSTKPDADFWIHPDLFFNHHLVSFFTTSRKSKKPRPLKILFHCFAKFAHHSLIFLQIFRFAKN